MKKAFLGIGFAAAGVTTALFEIGKAFDDASDTIRTKTGATGKDLKTLNKSFKDVVKTVPTDFGTAADAVAGLNQRLGLTGKPLTKLTKQVTQLSLVTGTDVQENVASITRLFGDWGVAADKQGKTLNKLYRASEDTGISVSDLARSMVQFGSPLRQLGIDFDHAAAMFSEFEQAGVNTQTLMPGLRFAIKAFSGATAATTEDMKKWGVSMDDPQKALQQIMQMIKDAPSNLKANQIAFEIFGQRAGPDMAAAIREGHFELDKLIKTMDSGKDTIGKAEKSTRDFSEQWKLFKNNVMVALEPAAKKVFGYFSDQMAKITDIISDKKLSWSEKWDKLTDLAMDALSKMISKAGTLAPKIAEALIKGFLNAPILGQLAIGGWLLSKMGGKGAFSALGTKSGQWFALAFIGAMEVKEIGNILSGELLDATTREMKATDLQKIGYTAIQFVGKGMITALGPDGNLNVFRQKNGEWIQKTVQDFHDWDEIPKMALRDGKSAYQNWDKLLGLTEATARDHGQKFHQNLGDAFSQVPKDSDATGEQTFKNWDKWLGKTATSGKDHAEQLKDGITSTIASLATAVGKGLQGIVTTTNNALKAFDVDPVAFAIAKGFDSGAQHHRTGGVIVPGQGNGDKVPAMLEPGEVVWNKKAVAAMGGAQAVNQMNSVVPRFQRGGGPGVGPVSLTGSSGVMQQLGQAALDLVRNAANKYIDKKSAAAAGPAVGTGGPGPGGVGSWMGVPMANWVISSLKYAASKGVSPQPTSGYRPGYDPHTVTGYSEHSGTVYPHGAVDFGGYVDPVALHNKLAVVAATRSYKWPLLAPIGFSDDGHASGTGHQRGGIIRKLATGGIIGRALPKALQKYNHLWAGHQSPDYSGPTMPVNDIAMLAEFFGMPGVTMAQIAHGESGYRPGAWGIDASPTPGVGETRGYGLWAITSPFANSYGVDRLGGYMGMLNPIANAIVASKMYHASGLSPWHGTRYLTSTNAHWQGDFGNLVSAAHPDQGGSGGGSGGGQKPPATHFNPNDVNPLWWQVLNPTPPPGGYPSAWGHAFLKHYKLPEKLRQSIQDAGQATQLLSGMIDTATTMAGFSYSPSGEDLSPDERANLIGLYQAYIGNLYDRQGKLQKGLDWLNSSSPLRPKLLDQLATIQGVNDGSIAAAMDKLYTLQNPTTATPDTPTDTTQLPDNSADQIALLKQLLSEANLRTAVSQLQYGVFANYAGAFAKGGKIGAGMWGIAGENGAEVVTGPARVYTPGQAQGLGANVQVHIYEGDPSATEVYVNGQRAKAAVTQATRGMGRRPLASSKGF